MTARCGLMVLVIALSVGVIATMCAHATRYVVIRRHFQSPTHAEGRFPTSDQLALMAAEVASRLRSGSSVQQAWQLAWKRHSFAGSSEIDSAGVPRALVSPLLPRRDRRRDITRGAAAQIVAACRFSFLSGAPLAEILEEVARGIGETVRGREAQDRAFAGPTLSARVLAALPVLAVVGGEVLGTSSVVWLLTNPLGRASLALGIAFLATGMAITYRIVSGARAEAKGQLTGTLHCDLLSVGLQAGNSIPSSLSVLAKATGDEQLELVAQQLRLGVSWGDAWEGVDGGALLCDALEPAWVDGVNPVPLLRMSARQVRERLVASVEETAEKVSVKLVLPLGLCYLPAFVFLGVVPVVFALLSSQMVL